MQRESDIDESHGKPSNFRGLVLTGWSRYDHFAVLCELLPVALPSLILNLQAISLNTTSEVTKFKQAEKLLKCLSSVESRNYDRLTLTSLEQDPHQFDLRRCKFPGEKLCVLLSGGLWSFYFAGSKLTWFLIFCLINVLNFYPKFCFRILISYFEFLNKI